MSSNIVRKITVLTVLLFLGLLWGCASKTEANMIVPKYTDSGGTIETQVDSRFMLVLPSNPTTGYSWQLAEPVKATIVRLYSSSYWEPMPPVPGKGGEERWTFQGTGKGQTTIKLIYVRPWEPKDISKRADYTVIVR